MSEPDRIDELLELWQDMQAANPGVTVTEMCRDDLHLLGEVTKRVSAIEAIERLRLPTSDTPKLGLDTTSLDSGPGTGTTETLPPALDFKKIGDYRIVRLLGEGGMGTVFVAEHVLLRRLDAVKVMKPALATVAAARERFLREAQTAAAVRHDHIVTIFHVGESEGVPFIAMELLAGESLEDRLHREPALSVAESIRIVREAAEGLCAAHAMGLIHRDIKPSNLFLSTRHGDTPRIKILDFGLARPMDGDGRITDAGAIMGSPAYMSPEQAGGAELDVRSDLFSLGSVLYRLLAGKMPFSGANTLAIIRNVQTATPTRIRELNPDVPPRLAALADWLMSKRPEDRPTSAREVISALRGMESPTVKKPGDGNATTELLPAAPPPKRRRSLKVAIASMASIILVGWLAFFIRQLASDSNPSTHSTARSPDKVQPALAPLKGFIDIRVWPDKTGTGPGRRLNRPENLPVKSDEWMRIEVELNRPAYIYIVWLDTDGKATPLYPWTDSDDWSSRPAIEHKRDRMSLPDAPGEIAPLAVGPPGIESLMLLCRDEPLPASENIRELFAGVPAQTTTDVRTAVWLENGTVDRKDLDRGPILTKKSVESENPVLRTQALLQTKLKNLFPYTRAVCFGNSGDSK